MRGLGYLDQGRRVSLCLGNAMSGISGECDRREDGRRGWQVSSDDASKIYLTTGDKDQQHVGRLETGTYEIPVDRYSCWTVC